MALEGVTGSGKSHVMKELLRKYVYGEFPDHVRAYMNSPRVLAAYYLGVSHLYVQGTLLTGCDSIDETRVADIIAHFGPDSSEGLEESTFIESLMKCDVSHHTHKPSPAMVAKWQVSKLECAETGLL